MGLLRRIRSLVAAEQSPAAGPAAPDPVGGVPWGELERATRAEGGRLMSADGNGRRVLRLGALPGPLAVQPDLGLVRFCWRQALGPCLGALGIWAAALASAVGWSGPAWLVSLGAIAVCVPLMSFASARDWLFRYGVPAGIAIHLLLCALVLTRDPLLVELAENQDHRRERLLLTTRGGWR